jgi:hypothetical protein
MQAKGWKNLSSWIFLLASFSANCCCTGVDAARAKNLNLSDCDNDLVTSITSLAYTRITDPSCQQQSNVAQVREVASLAPPELSGDYQQRFSELSELSNLYSQTSPNETQPTPQRKEPPSLESLPTNDFPKTTPSSIEQPLLLPGEIDYTERQTRLLQRLQENQMSSESNSDDELGRLVVRQRQLEQLPPPPLKPPTVQSKPVGFLLAHLGYFHTSNIFSSTIPINDSLIFSGLTLASAPLPLGSKTFVSGSIDGNLIRYINQSKYNYSQIRFNLDLYQQLTKQMYGDLGWSNQQLFYARDGSFYRAGQRFLNENSLRLSLGRRDPLTSKLMLDSFYEFRLSFTDPPNGSDNRNRVINSLWVSLNYYLQKSLQIGADYQFSLSNFTERFREDQYHQLFAHLTYGISDYSNVSLQGGVTLGDSTDVHIDFNGWFFGLYYNVDLGRF